MKSLISTALAVPFALTLFAGCSSGRALVPVKGTLTRAGQPVKNATVSFYPDGKGHASMGVTDEQGRFELRYDKDTKGAAVGHHKVVVAFRPRNPQEEMDANAGKLTFHPEQAAILAKYGKLESTALAVDITNAETGLQLKVD